MEWGRTFAVWDILQSSWDRGFEFHFEVSKKRRDSVLRDSQPDRFQRNGPGSGMRGEMGEIRGMRRPPSLGTSRRPGAEKGRRKGEQPALSVVGGEASGKHRSRSWISETGRRRRIYIMMLWPYFTYKSIYIYDLIPPTLYQTIPGWACPTSLETEQMISVRLGVTASSSSTSTFNGRGACRWERVFSCFFPLSSSLHQCLPEVMGSILGVCTVLHHRRRCSKFSKSIVLH